MRELQKMIDSGSIHYHAHVIADIAKAAVEEVDGASLVGQEFSDSVLELIGVKRLSGVVVKIERFSNSVSLEVRINVRYGKNIPETARLVQDVVRERFEQLTDIDLRDVNVNVQGIERAKS